MLPLPTYELSIGAVLLEIGLRLQQQSQRRLWVERHEAENVLRFYLAEAKSVRGMLNFSLNWTARRPLAAG